MNGGRRGKILIVDDSAMQRELLAEVIEEQGYEVVTAASGLDGISKAFEERPDVIVSDVVMPEINGFHLCRFIKNDPGLGHTPVILLTSSALTRKNRFWGLQSGAETYLPKDGSHAHLLRALEQLAPPPGRDEPASGGIVVSPMRKNIAAGIAFLFDRLLFESTLANEIKKLGEFVHSREVLVAQFAGVLDSLVGYAAVAMVGAQMKQVFICVRQTIGQQTVEGIVKGLAGRLVDHGLEALRLKVALLPASKVKGAIEPELAGADDPRQIIHILRIEDQVLGAVSVVLKKSERRTAELEHNLYLAVRELAPIVRTQLYYEETERLSRSDSLTHVYNYRYFLEKLKAAFEGFVSGGPGFSLVMIDVDGFRGINELHGYFAGDRVLAEIGLTLQRKLKTGDLPARFSGDQFLILLPETDSDGAKTVAERLCERLAKLGFQEDGRSFSITASFAVVTARQGMTSLHDLIGTAEVTLERAKAAGGGCVICHGEG